VLAVGAVVFTVPAPQGAVVGRGALLVRAPNRLTLARVECYLAT
jgi:hypothetical protein